MVAGTLLVMAGVQMTARHHRMSTAYAKLAEQVVTDPAYEPTSMNNPLRSSSGNENTVAGDAREDSASPTIDWDQLKQSNPDVAAWVCVGNTDISLPVVLPADGDMSFYLNHDFWRRQSVEGSPFLDHRCTADGTHRMAYGHHLSMGGQFSSLQTAYQQEIFDTLGMCQWTTAKGGTTLLQPLCALRVDMWFEGIQRFSFDDASSLGSWLQAIAEASPARCADWRTASTAAKSVVTLVTCSSNLAGKPWRTLVVFVELERPSRAPS